MVKNLENPREPLELWVEVIPNSKKFSITIPKKWEKKLKIKVRGKALKGQANKELVTELRKIGVKSEIVFGEKSRKKIIRLEGLTEQELIDKVSTQKP